MRKFATLLFLKMSSSGFRASIPDSVKKTIQNIKEITGNHSDEDIYAMLKECSMDPNETTQKLLLQGIITSLLILFLVFFVIHVFSQKGFV